MAAQDISFDITPEKQASKLQFLRRQFSRGIPDLSLRDASLGGRTILAVRDEANGEAVRQSLITTKAFPHRNQVVQVWKLDYGSYESIMEFARRAQSLYPRPDTAILNAGVNRGSFAINLRTGHEDDLQNNYLSTALLTLLLLCVFKKAQSPDPIEVLWQRLEYPESPSEPFRPGRIVVVSFDTAAWSNFDERNHESLLKALDDEANFDKIGRYATTKLLGQLFVGEQSRRVSPSLAVVNCANPGLCYSSGLHRELGWATAVFTRIIGRSAVVGARSIVCAAVKSDESSHGRYVEDGELRPMAPFVYSKEAEQTGQRLWRETMDELAFAGVEEFLEGLAQA